MSAPKQNPWRFEVKADMWGSTNPARFDSAKALSDYISDSYRDVDLQDGMSPPEHLTIRAIRNTEGAE